MSTISGDQTQFLNDGTKINYCTSGNGNHPVLLLPGALGTGRSDFTPQLEGVNTDMSIDMLFLSSRYLSRKIFVDQIFIAIKTINDKSIKHATFLHFSKKNPTTFTTNTELNSIKNIFGWRLIGARRGYFNDTQIVEKLEI